MLFRLALNLSYRFFCIIYSPEGMVKAAPVLTGMPKLGVPSVFQLIFCIRIFLVGPQPWPVVVFA